MSSHFNLGKGKAFSDLPFYKRPFARIRWVEKECHKSEQGRWVLRHGMYRAAFVVITCTLFVIQNPQYSYSLTYLRRKIAEMQGQDWHDVDASLDENGRRLPSTEAWALRRQREQDAARENLPFNQALDEWFQKFQPVEWSRSIILGRAAAVAERRAANTKKLTQEDVDQMLSEQESKRRRGGSQEF